ncbi:OmpA family protein [Vibrio vulnificus]|nr:OmpA family protein [Vibrio vulnificus]
MLKNICLPMLLLAAMTGCQTTQNEIYQEVTPQSIDDLFSVTTTEQVESFEQTKENILAEHISGYTASEFIRELGEKNVDLSALDDTLVQFDFDSYSLSQNAKTTIEKHVALLRNEPLLKVILEGHTDAMGDRAYNLKLGERRAMAVLRYAEELGANAEQFEVISYGEEKLLNNGRSADDHKANRRAVFSYN